MDITNEEIQEAIQITVSVGRIVKELVRVPEGHVYHVLMPVMSLDAFNSCINQLVQAKLIKRENHELIWIGDLVH